MADGSASRFEEAADILVVGAGPAGLAAGIAAAAAGFETRVVDHAALNAGGEDPRTTAILEPSIAFLSRIGAWGAVEPHGVALRVMRLIETGGAGGGVRKTAPFDAKDLGQSRFGVNVGAMELRRALCGVAASTRGLRLDAPRPLAAITRREDAVIARFEDGGRLTARLVIAADGRESRLRAEAGIGVRRVDYPQAAVVAILGHDVAHQNISTEIHAAGGPFTLVPFLSDLNGRPQCGLVWMEREAEAGRLMALSPADFAAAATERSLGILGPLRLNSERRRWPMTSMIADRFQARRLALVAEAAHVTPPIGAQGFNMSLRDIERLIDLLTEARSAGRDIGDAAALKRYERARWPEVAARVLGVGALNVAAMGALAPVRAARLFGLSALYDVAPLRKVAMRYGLGV